MILVWCIRTQSALLVSCCSSNFGRFRSSCVTETSGEFVRLELETLLLTVKRKLHILVSSTFRHLRRRAATSAVRAAVATRLRVRVCCCCRAAKKIGRVRPSKKIFHDFLLPSLQFFGEVAPQGRTPNRNHPFVMSQRALILLQGLRDHNSSQPGVGSAL